MIKCPTELKTLHCTILCEILMPVFARDSIYAIAHICYRNSVRTSGRPDVCLSHGWIVHKKLSYRRETARQLHTTTWAGQLTF